MQHPILTDEKETYMKDTRRVLSAICAGIAIVALSPMAAQASEGEGGWGEDQGGFVEQGTTLNSLDLLATVKHTGKAEYKTIGGTTHKRAHGWTTWKGKYHYTTAQLEHYWPYKGVIATSGRQWGTNGTEAMTKWVAFSPDAPSSGYGKARTYYGTK